MDTKHGLKYVIVLCVFLCGCATYNIQQEKGGFAVARYKKVIPEYTSGKEGSFPDKELAEERFKRRKKRVEYYYKKMGFIDNRFKQTFIEPPVVFIKFVTGILRVPFIMVSDYKYNHNPQYKEKIDKLEDQRYEAERARTKGLKEELGAYIKEDLAGEPYPQDTRKVKEKKAKGKVVTPQATDKAAELKLTEPAEVKPQETKLETALPQAVKPEEPKPVEVTKTLPETKSYEVAVTEPVVKEEVKPQAAARPEVVLAKPNAVIIARPQSGQSPLKISFSGARSRSPNGRIISYEWDFGDGDKSNKPNPTNTYWSTTYGTREYTATLTVTDNSGMVSSSSVVIRVVNK